jgi:hypothetical protein
MPTIKLFDQCRVEVRPRDHSPPHFHIVTQGGDMSVCIETLACLKGRVPGRISRQALEWAKENQDVLLKKWEFLNLPRRRS